VTAADISYKDAEGVATSTVSRRDRLDISPIYFEALGLGKRIILFFLLNRDTDLMLIESHDLPADEDWDKMERDEMWRMHVRMCDTAQMMAGDADSTDGSEESDADET
jgi:hypothetical protein